MRDKIFYITCFSIIFICLFLFIFFNFHIEINVSSEKLNYGQELMNEPKAYLKGYVLFKKGKELDIKKVGNIDYTSLGTYQIMYEASFLFWKNKTIQIVEIIDNEAPIISLKGEKNYFYYKGTSYEEPGFVAYDNYDKEITEKVTIEQNEKEIIYRVKDSSGNETKEIRNLFFYKDIEFPILTLKGNKVISLDINEKYEEPGFFANDNIDGNITTRVQINSNLNTSKEGNYTIEYLVSDNYGNTTKEIRIIKIINKEKLEQEKKEEQIKEIIKEETSKTEVEIIIPGKIEDKIEIKDNEQKPSIIKPKEDLNKIIYLTFDDGPSQYTIQLLDILDKYDIKATFFIVNKEKYIDLVKEEYKRGHTIALHTESHDYEIYKSKETYLEDLYAIQDIVEEQIGIKSYLMRFPGGSSNSISKKYSKGIMTELTKEVENRGFTYFDWNVTGGDSGKGANKESVIKNIITNIPKYKQSIVLQHDTKQFSVEAVEDIIIWGLENGYTFKTLTPNGYVYHHTVNN